ncbi:siderophore-interacting protein [Phenylobacterium aquaticum]|uniref:siderophore-interacting protein n=1 Tax=Phenylobacterium aquaticum TaxID=1763816 RepID=UPI001F5E0876|nr:siderophore-interacting protein [Phenylobacterium aquaticum]MCI3135416.1 siderophore-interacting protein [Phenylobacterium aquaticum]
MPSPFPGRPNRPPLPVRTLTLADTQSLTPHARRLTFTGEGLSTLAYQPGQDLVLLLPLADGTVGRRHYTIRSLDRATGRLAIDFVIHGHGGPGEHFALTARPGDTVEAAGPRGRTVVNLQADWHLFVADETGLPGVLAMLESLPEQVRAFAMIEVEDKDDRQLLDAYCDLDLDWLVRGGPALPASLGLIERVALFAPRPGRGHAYLMTETSTVQTIRRGLLARGFAKDQISAEGYWRPGRQGGHDHIMDEADLAARMAARA